MLLLPLGAGMLTLAAVDDLLMAGAVAAGVEQDLLAPILPWFTVSFAGGGFILLLAGLASLLRSTNREQQWRPYVSALKPLAAEFGRGVVESANGIEIQLQRDGQRVDVHLDPRPGGRLVVQSAAPARQALTWFRRPAKPAAEVGAWREVERTERWEMRAQLPAMARPLLADPALMDVVQRFFELREGTSVTHTVAGMVIEAALVSPESVDAQARLCLEIAFRLRRVNG